MKIESTFGLDRPKEIGAGAHPRKPYAEIIKALVKDGKGVRVPRGELEALGDPATIRNGLYSAARRRGLRIRINFYPSHMWLSFGPSVEELRAKLQEKLARMIALGINPDA